LSFGGLLILQNLINICLNQDPTKRPDFTEIITLLEDIEAAVASDNKWKPGPEQTQFCVDLEETESKSGDSDGDEFDQ
jgi:hypothetical protein